jgi:peptidylprolyl isomerase/FKBP-type peptidyl-prolyl cis-trans isomerase FkpA
MKNSWIIYTIIVIIVLLFTGGLFWWSLQPTETKMENTQPVKQNITELKIEDIVVGTGAEAKSGDTVTVNYLGTLLNGTKFDSSYDRNQPFSFQLGAGQVIVGWDKGLLGMKVGGKRKLTIPSEMAYGSRGAGGVIGPNEPLIFEIELLKL